MKIRTSGKVTTATVTVTSRDFGGHATLTGTVDPDGAATSAIVQGGPEDGQDYTNIPVDRDGNGIADSWEQPYCSQSPASCSGTPPGLNPQADNEAVSSVTGTPQGDGLFPQDEYRGFVVLQNGNNVLVRTDPVRTQDVFYWDDSGQFSGALNAMLAPQTAPNIAFWQVDADHANPNDEKGQDASRGVGPINFNGSPSSKAYAVVYYDDGVLANGTLGTADKPGAELVNNGVAIGISLSNIAAQSQQTAFPQSVLLQEVVAHETGHKFGRPHPLRLSPCCVPQTFNLSARSILSLTSTTL